MQEVPGQSEVHHHSEQGNSDTVVQSLQVESREWKSSKIFEKTEGILQSQWRNRYLVLCNKESEVRVTIDNLEGCCVSESLPWGPRFVYQTEG